MTSKRGSHCDIYIWFLQVLTILVLASLAIWATLTPKTPTFTITNMDLKPYIRNDTVLGTNSSFLAFNVTISNPNKMTGVFLDEINVTIGCNNESVTGSRSWSKSVAGFYLGHSVSDLKEVDLSVEDNELLLCRKVDYYLKCELETGVRYKVMWFKTRHRRLVFEDYVEIGYGHGQMLGTTQMKLKLSFTNL
ncbi:NDR1/HIN1-like protein 3 [Cucumis melo]|uniref:NDR1/HIN1-like protein 3 n=1 Tax=Cucumis melo TaxID=3656 RepID=A0ABM3KDZ0_CUCME|nr:NDR1/HIN1-like protein 3 [Cucumis melo]